MTPRWKAIISLALVLSSVSAVLAEPFAQPAFRSLWERTGVPIQRGAADYSWIWGPEPFTPELSEALAEAAGGRRAVQYFDKSRMEINDPAANPNSLWYITNGLLVTEMVNGQVQVGLNDFIPLAPATIAIAGDPDNAFPTYADLDELVNTPPSGTLGNHATRSFLAGGFGEFPQYANSPATEIVQLVRGRGVPRAFWSYINRRGTVYEGGRLVPNQPLFDWLYTLGYPTTEPFWTRARLGGVERDVLFQAFERRLLTYVPDNPAQYQVEMGNVGRHYYQWRYEAPFAGGEKAIITVPESGALVSNPLQVRGFENGQAFEAAITVRLRNIASGEILARANTQVARTDVGKAGPFTATLTFTPPAQNTPARIEIVTFSPRDGSETVLASRDVVVGPSAGASPPIAQAKQMLARRLNIPHSEIGLLSVEYVEWNNAALECPAPGQVYATVITPGYRIVLEAQGQQYTYHTNMDSQIVLCENGHPAGAVPSRISWDEAQQLIMSGQVAQVTQLHSLEVRLLLKDGRMVVTTEPAIDDVFELVRQCGAPCSDIVLVTE